MTAKMSSYEKTKAAIRKKKANAYLSDHESPAPAKRSVDMLDVAKVGTGVLIGGGIGILSGVATIAVAAGAAEVVLGAIVTKTAGVVGGAAGLGWGLNQIEKKRGNSITHEEGGETHG